MPKIFQYFEILKKQPHKFRFILSRILMKTGLSQYFVFSRNGYALRFYPSALTAALWINPKERLEEEKMLSSLAKPGDRVIDVGANIGTISLALAKAMNGEGEIHAIEPHPRIYDYLHHNNDLNGFNSCIRTYRSALGDQSDSLFFSDHSDDTNNSLVQSGKIKVSVNRLDELISPAATKLLKIDVEGHEYQVLLGAPETIAQTEMIYFECIPSMLEKHNSSEVMICDLLENAGFNIYRLEQGNMTVNQIGSDKKKMLIAKR